MRHTPLATEGLIASSINVILDAQHPSGAYAACVDYPTYRYAWLRDGSFTAYAMDRHHHTYSAEAFHQWVTTTMLGHRRRIAGAISAADQFGHTGRMMPTRFTLNGQAEVDAEEVWPNFQLDGYGTWLWALADHHAHTGEALGTDRQAAVELVADYLTATADLPCYDCWEEHRDRHHTSTLAAIAAGLDAAGRLLDTTDLHATAAALTRRINTDHVVDGTYIKHDADHGVDASLLWLALPFDLVAVDDPVMAATAAQIRRDLQVDGGGVRRYLGDTFYGGGEWILLTAWLGWYDAVCGNEPAASGHQRWIEQHATGDGHLPEQTTAHPQQADMVQQWIEQWGPVATPLVWSHAMYLVLIEAIGRTS